MQTLQSLQDLHPATLYINFDFVIVLDACISPEYYLKLLHIQLLLKTTNCSGNP